jgi:hypothetical protein
MNNVLDFIDKFKFGIIAAFATYIFIFIFLQMESYTQYFPIEPFHDGAIIEQSPEIELQPENIDTEGYNQDIKSISRDANDKREKSPDNWSQNQTAKQAEQAVKDYEKELFEESGGSQERKRIQEQMERDRQNNEKATTPTTKPQAKSGGDKAFDGAVMVEWSLADRFPHQKNNWYVRNPGYTCGYGSNGVVFVDIKVNSNGDVIQANYSASRSQNANACMIEQGVNYAKKSRFAYSSSAPKIQEGTIVYRFVSQ